MSGTQARRAWYAITLDRVLVALLVVVGLLFLSDSVSQDAVLRLLKRAEF